MIISIELHNPASAHTRNVLVQYIIFLRNIVYQLSACFVDHEQFPLCGCLSQSESIVTDQMILLTSASV